MKHYAKKRSPVVAAQWTGEMTSEIAAIVEGHNAHVGADRQLVFSNEKGPGRFACVGDWIASSSGEDLFVIGDEQFRGTYEEVDATGRPLLPTDEEHDVHFAAFVQKLNAILAAGLLLSPEVHAGIWRDRNALLSSLRNLLEEHAWIAKRSERQRIRDKIAKELAP